MSRITYIGMDVHSTSFTFCALEPNTSGQDQVFAYANAKPDYKEVVKYINMLKEQRGKDCRFICAYEAGCLGYTLYHQLTQCGIECVILAPSTMPVLSANELKPTSVMQKISLEVSRTVSEVAFSSPQLKMKK